MTDDTDKKAVTLNIFDPKFMENVDERKPSILFGGPDTMVPIKHLTVMPKDDRQIAVPVRLANEKVFLIYRRLLPGYYSYRMTVKEIV